MSCCSRKRTWKDFLYLPVAIATSMFGLVMLLTIETAIAYSLGFI